MTPTADREYVVRFIPSDAKVHPLDENIDVEVVFEDGTRYVATFFTLANIKMLFEKNARTGECANGTYFWASDMIIVRALTMESVYRAVADLIASGEFEKAFAGPYPEDS